MGTVQFLSFSLLYTKTLFLFSKASKNCSAPTQQIFFGKAICISSLQKSCYISSIFAQCSKKFCNLSLRICPKTVFPQQLIYFNQTDKTVFIFFSHKYRNYQRTVRSSRQRLFPHFGHLTGIRGNRGFLSENLLPQSGQ